MKDREKYIFLALALIVILLLVYLSYQYFILRNQLNDPVFLANLQSQQVNESEYAVITKLSSIMLLPDESDPKIAIINDIDKLKSGDPEFYKNAVNGDTLVLYSELAIIYRDSANKIINIAPIAQDEN